MNQQGPANRLRVKPDRAQRDRPAPSLDRRRDERSPRGHQDLLRDRLAALDLNGFFANLTGLEAGARANTHTIGAELLDKEIGVVDQPRGHTPRAVAIVSDADPGRTDEGSPRNGPIRGPDVQEVPGRGQRGRKMRIIRQERTTTRGSVSGQDPVVRGASRGRVFGKNFKVRLQHLKGRPGRLTRWHSRGLRIRRDQGIKRQQRLHSIQVGNTKPRELLIPVGREQERKQGEDRAGVEGRKFRRGGSQQGELVSLADPPGGAPAVDSPCKRLDRLQEGILLQLETFSCRLVEADPTAELVHRQGLGANQGGQGASAQTLQRLQLKGPVLPLAEARGEPGIDIVGGPNMRNSPAVPNDLNLFERTIEVKPPLCLRQPATQHQPEERSQDTHQTNSALKICASISKPER